MSYHHKLRQNKTTTIEINNRDEMSKHYIDIFLLMLNMIEKVLRLTSLVCCDSLKRKTVNMIMVNYSLGF